MRGMVMGVGFAALALAGCSTGLDNIHTGSFFVQPGKYQFLKCPDLTQRSVAVSYQEKELVSLMERASQDVAGPVVNLMAYSSNLHQVRADLEEVQRTMREKGCDSLVPASNAPAPASPAPAPAPGRKH